MKKIIPIILATALIFSMTACSDDGSSTPTVVAQWADENTATTNAEYEAARNTFHDISGFWVPNGLGFTAVCETYDDGRTEFRLQGSQEMYDTIVSLLVDEYGEPLCSSENTDNWLIENGTDENGTTIYKHFNTCIDNNFEVPYVIISYSVY